MGTDSDEAPAMEKRMNLRNLIRLFLLLGLVATWLVLYHYTNLFQYFTKDKISTTIDAIREFVGNFGMFGPVVFVVAGSIAMTINLSTLFIICLSVVTFGKVTGAIISFIIVCIGITLIYFFAQLLGRPFVKGLSGKRLKKVEERLRERGLMMVFYLRLAFFMSPPVNWLLSTTSISYRDFFLGTLLGTAHTIILTVWLTGMIIEIISAGQSLNPIKTPKLLLPICITSIIFIIAKIIDRSRKVKTV